MSWNKQEQNMVNKANGFDSSKEPLVITLN